MTEGPLQDRPGSVSEETLGERMLRMRRRLGMSQLDLAGLLGVDRSSVVAWEHDRHAPTQRRQSRLARVLGCTVQYLEEGDAGEALRRLDAALMAMKKQG